MTTEQEKKQAFAMLKPGETEEQFDIHIDVNGNWYHRGGLIERKKLIRLFSTVLKRDEQGDYWLATPVEKGRITVEDVPFVALEMQIEGEGKTQKLRFRTNLDHWVTAGPDHPIRVVIDAEKGEPRPYLQVRPGLEARINRPLFFDLVSLAERHVAKNEQQNDSELSVWSDQAYFSLGSVSE